MISRPNNGNRPRLLQDPRLGIIGQHAASPESVRRSIDGAIETDANAAAELAERRANSPRRLANPAIRSTDFSDMINPGAHRLVGRRRGVDSGPRHSS